MKNKYSTAIFGILATVFLILAVTATQDATAVTLYGKTATAEHVQLAKPLAKQTQVEGTFELTAGLVGQGPSEEAARNSVYDMRGFYTATKWKSQPYNEPVLIVSWKGQSYTKPVLSFPRVKKSYSNRCAEFVGNAIEAGGVPLDRSLNPTPRNSASGYGPVLEDAGFRTMVIGTVPQAGDVAIFPPIPKHPHGHATMFDGKTWKSDFSQKDIYANPRYREQNAPFTLYRRP